jgi:hypothetical protein
VLVVVELCLGVAGRRVLRHDLVYPRADQEVALLRLDLDQQVGALAHAARLGILDPHFLLDEPVEQLLAAFGRGVLRAVLLGQLEEPLREMSRRDDLVPDPDEHLVGVVRRSARRRARLARRRRAEPGHRDGDRQHQREDANPFHARTTQTFTVAVTPP